MHPALSVILFTTASGAGYGLLFLIGLLTGTPFLPESRWFALAAFALSLGAISFGLMASTFHLGRPERAWRAISQWRSSWLSREGIASLATYVPAGALAVLWVFYGRTLPWLGWLTAFMAVVTVYCTAMIYASLKPIPRWHHPLVPAVYLLLGLMTGTLLLQALLALFSHMPVRLPWFAILVLVAGLAVKLAYWRSIDKAEPHSTAESATGLGALGRVRLLEAPHTSENYLMKEMGHAIARKHAGRLRWLSMFFGFLLPLLLTLLALALPPLVAAGAVVIAALSGLAGVLLERWLFFAEAKHAVTLYYGTAAV
jgi:sulfite dehydrogenase (quinone) subunit SoeC